MDEIKLYWLLGAGLLECLTLTVGKKKKDGAAGGGVSAKKVSILRR